MAELHRVMMLRLFRGGALPEQSNIEQAARSSRSAHGSASRLDTVRSGQRMYGDVRSVLWFV
jgi:hypothetical protein